LGSLNSTHLFLTVLEADKSKIKVPTDSLPGDSPLPGLQMATFLLYPHMLGRERALITSSSHKGMNRIMGALPSMGFNM